MTEQTLSWLLGLKTPTYAPADEGTQGGGDEAEGDETGNDSGGDAGEDTQTTDPVLGGDQTDGKSEEGADAEDDAEKDKSDDTTDDDEGGEDDTGSEVPEDGSYEFNVPEGIEVSDEQQQQWSEHFKELGLTRAQAAKLVEVQSEQMLAQQKMHADMLVQQQNDHLAAAKEDKEIGGENWDESVSLANKGLKAFGGDAVKDLILSTGNGNNPEIIRELRRFGEMVKDDTFESGATHEEPPTKETSWYGNTTPDSKKG